MRCCFGMLRGGETGSKARCAAAARGVGLGRKYTLRLCPQLGMWTGLRASWRISQIIYYKSKFSYC